MSRRLALPLLGITFWLAVALAGTVWYLRDGPKSPLIVQTSRLGKYELALFTSPTATGSLQCFVYARQPHTAGAEWHYVNVMSVARSPLTTQAWSSTDDNKLLVAFSDCYFVSDLKHCSLHEAKFLPVALANQLLSATRHKYKASRPLSFSKPHTIGLWKWQDPEWKAMVRDNPYLTS